ncbi:hypothetical protein [Terriglobus albidus]|uniref:hypothetical protein n=1 Tax=Terriglobus albidus TaxID=1592106 RepID=UPI0021E0E333|nr:hypothetical protein [Terriglobus albidus]
MRLTTMRPWMVSIWYIGCAVWLGNAWLAIYSRSRLHALVSLLLSVTFFAAGTYYRKRTP